jgi:5-aminolevulinate synthase
LLKRRLETAGVPHLRNDSHIVPVMVGDAVLCKRICDELLDADDIYIQPINDPTVPRGIDRLRITPSPLHSDEDIDRLVAALSRIWSTLDLQKAA